MNDTVSFFFTIAVDWKKEAYTVAVNREGNLDLRNTLWCRWDTELEVAEELVIADQFTFTLEDLDLDSGLTVSSSAEDLGLLGGDGGVTV